MTDVTYERIATVPAKPTAGQGFWRWLFDTLVEARRLEAEAMIKHRIYGGY
jgi:hypothetical protein